MTFETDQTLGSNENVGAGHNFRTEVMRESECIVERDIS
jgi:hypothetical protein